MGRQPLTPVQRDSLVRFMRDPLSQEERDKLETALTVGALTLAPGCVFVVGRVAVQNLTDEVTGPYLYITDKEEVPCD